MQSGEPPDNTLVLEPVGRVDVDPIGQFVTLELHPAREREFDFRPAKARILELACNILIADQNPVQPLVAPEGTTYTMSSGPTVRCWAYSSFHSGNGIAADSPISLETHSMAMLIVFVWV